MFLLIENAPIIFEILAWTLYQVFFMVSFYSDAELMHKLGK